MSEITQAATDSARDIYEAMETTHLAVKHAEDFIGSDADVADLARHIQALMDRADHYKQGRDLVVSALGAIAVKWEMEGHHKWADRLRAIQKGLGGR